MVTDDNSTELWELKELPYAGFTVGSGAAEVDISTKGEERVDTSRCDEDTRLDAESIEETEIADVEGSKETGELNELRKSSYTG